MKKILSLVLSLVLVMSVFTACGSKEEPKEEVATEETGTEEAAEEVVEEPAEEEAAEEVATGGVKTGLAVITSTAKSADAGEEDGLAQADSVVVAVTVDEAGVITKCVIDSAQTKINFSNEGKITTDLASVFVAKQELGTDYGMAKASAIGKEWNEQADALAEYVVGKTVDEVKGIAVNEEGAPSDEDLASSVTVGIGGYVDAIEKAVANAVDLGASATDTLGLGIVTTIAKSTDAGEEDGLAQAYSMYTATTFGADGKITSAVIDGSQTNVNFDAEGKITSDIAGEYKTKNELGADYGMASASGIGKEWNEQAEAYAAYVVGKTIDEVKGIAVDETSVPTEEDLVGSVTIHTADFITVLEKASANAK